MKCLFHFFFCLFLQYNAYVLSSNAQSGGLDQVVDKSSERFNEMSAIAKEDPRLNELNEKSKNSTISEAEVEELQQGFCSLYYKENYAENESALHNAPKRFKIFVLIPSQNCTLCDKQVELIQNTYKPYKIDIDIMNAYDFYTYISEKNLGLPFERQVFESLFGTEQKVNTLYQKNPSYFPIVKVLDFKHNMLHHVTQGYSDSACDLKLQLVMLLDMAV